jgi:uncharacterized protein YbjT (DUF2867 family)
MTQRIIITGATGNTGQVVAAELYRRGLPFVAMARREDARRQLAGLGYGTVAGDFDDPASLEPALRKAAKVYLVCTPDEHLVRRETAFIAAAQRAGVEHIVRCSAYKSALDAETQNLRSHGVIDQALVDSGIAYTILRPIGFMQTFTLFMWDTVQRAGAISLPTGDGGMPMIDVRDVAAVAVKALTEPGYEGGVYDLTGPASLNNYEVAAIMSRVLNRPITYIPGDERQTRWIMKVLGVPRTPREHVDKCCRMQRERRIEQVHTTLQELGVEPTTYEQFLRDWVAGRTGGGNSFQAPDTMVARLFKLVMPALLRLRLRLAPPPPGPASGR